MAGKIKIKHVNKSFVRRPIIKVVPKAVPTAEEKKLTTEAPKSKKSAQVQSNKEEDKTDTDMLTQEQLKQIEASAENLKPVVKVLKKDKGLIERTESSKIVLTEDNRQVLND